MFTSACPRAEMVSAAGPRFWKHAGDRPRRDGHHARQEGMAGAARMTAARRRNARSAAWALEAIGQELGATTRSCTLDDKLVSAKSPPLSPGR